MFLDLLCRYFSPPLKLQAAVSTPSLRVLTFEASSSCYVSTSLKLETEGLSLLRLYLFVVVVVSIVHVSTVTSFLHEEMLKPGHSKQVVKLRFLQ